MLNKQQIRDYICWSLEDLKFYIDKDRNTTLKNLLDKEIHIYKMGMVASLMQFQHRYSKVTKTYKKISDKEFNLLVGLEDLNDE